MLFSSSIFLFCFLPIVLILYYYPLYLPVTASLKAVIAVCSLGALLIYLLPFQVPITAIVIVAAILFLFCAHPLMEKLLPSSRTVRNIILLTFSLLFYTWGEPLCVILLLFSCLLNYLAGLWCSYYVKTFMGKVIVGLTVSANIAVFFVFKYMGFVFENLSVFVSEPIDYVKLALPLGISFYTFQALSYVIDVYRGNAEAEKNPFRIALYISLFPQLVAGPIVRYSDIAAELTERHENISDFAAGTIRFTCGLAKKMILANTCAVLADTAFETATGNLSVLGAWLGAIGYTLQIYFDFSGYSDMAIGLGRMFGFHFLENFNFPYIARSITDFWRRWHISLSGWFRDYVYFPLGGNRVTKLRLFFNLFVMWLLTGIWHGASWNFVCWGLLYFVLLVIEKSLGLDRTARWWGWFYTMPAVIAAWVLFRSPDLSYAWNYLKVMVGANGTSLYLPENIFMLREYWAFLLAAVVFSIPIVPILKERGFYLGRIKNMKFRICCAHLLEGSTYLCMVLLLFIAVSFVVKSTNNPFIYFNF